MNQRPALAESRRKLLEAREKRIHPERDEKVLTSWNGLMLTGLADAGRLLGEPRYLDLSAHGYLDELRELVLEMASR